MIITLLSDFGLQDNFVAVARGILLQELPDAQLIDLSHEVRPFHLLQCSYLLASSFSNFPKGTVHLSLFDTMHHQPAYLLITEIKGQFIISADNGLLPLTFNHKLPQVYNSGKIPASYSDWLLHAAVFIRELKEHAFSFNHLVPFSPAIYPIKLRPIIKDDSVECQIIHIDRYENVVLNITKEEFEEQRRGRNFLLKFLRNESINKISSNYSDVLPGEKLCLFNTAGYLEIAVNRGNAASLLGLQLHNEKSLVYQNIKIDFQ